MSNPNFQARTDHSDTIARALATPGGHLAIGRGGATLYFDQGWLSGCVPDDIKAEAIAAGLPVIDSLNVPFDVVWRLAVNGPMVAVGREPDAPPWNSLSHAPLKVVARAYRDVGAEVLNLDLSVPVLPVGE